MKTTLARLIITLFCSLQLVAQEVKDDCDCPEPTKEQFSKVCVSIYQKSGAHDPTYASFSYQENLWRLACVDPAKDSKAEKARKIQCMWNKYRTLFRCYGYPTSIASDANVIKFSMDTGFTPFIYESIRYNKLDMNFIDPADGKTPLDWMQERITWIQNSHPVDVRKLEEYKRYYKLFRDNGAKHANEL